MTDVQSSLPGGGGAAGQAAQDVPGGFDAPVGGGGGGAGNFNLPSFSKALGNVPSGAIDLLRDVDLNVKIELGRTKMLVEDVLKLAEGSVVELDKLAGDPVDVFVNDQLVARGEVLVLNDNFCVRINEIITTLEE
jgi:flagellar motor switch protein FliN